ncbi:secretion protein HlyD family protein [Arcobacter nitrofigilis DSM 7299]|uniref:Secretion protein HlyD family protein n=1 Tax=Arcobacter nitrofigilis (strain ATCC 33309 / DSM 7299 / CCUG 15893 / LMG 7604 / NCTC 12251 / CI) TaxID=572480 RepID=D5V2N8_ARCNC|nr:efflux RND transporter periplasmic adaptor subunit [Arcobacter nitrofigilis]ADG92470.1 secretion protein HlyD family protein [Arcobacter nitrofigilis DSM 7299]
MKTSYLSHILKVFILLIISMNLYAEPLELSSFIVSNNQKTISSKYNGYIEKFYINEGDYVKKGKLLLKIDSKEMSTLKSQTILSIEQAKLNFNIIKSDLGKATIDFDRYKRLFEKQLISKSDFENFQLKKSNLEKNLQIAKKSIKQSEDKLQEINKNLKYLNIRASSDGLIIKKNINEGELATAGTPLLTISDVDNLNLYLDVAESDLSKFREKENLDIYIESLNINQKAKVVAILPSVDSGTNSFRVKLSFKRTDNRVLPGMYAKVRVE